MKPFLFLALAAVVAVLRKDSTLEVQIEPDPDVLVEITEPVEAPWVKPPELVEPTGPAVLGSYETKYGAGTSRGHNIERAAIVFRDGIMIEPGDTLSFNEMVGPRDQRHGFYKAHVIVDGEMIDGDGGGVCQVSSTIHAAARMAGLTVVERLPHTRPSAYIAPGLDATVSWPSKDLKVKNDFEEAVVLDVETQRDPKNRWVGILTAKVYGTRAVPASKYTYKTGPSGSSFEQRVKQNPDCTDCPKKTQKGLGGTIVWSKMLFADGSFTEWRSAYPATEEIWELKPGQAVPDEGQGR
jgi:VanW like protein